MKVQMRKLQDVLFFQEGPGVRKFQFRESGVKLLNVGNINNGTLNTNTTKLYISDEEAYGKYSHFLVDEGDLLIASSGVVVNNFHNKIAFATKEDLPLCLNTSTIRFKTLDKSVFNINYFKFFLKTIFFKSQLRRLITGSAQLNFGPSHLKQINVPVPTLSDQLHIANLLSKAENLITQRKQSIALLDEFLKSTFLEMFGDPLVNPKGFKIKKLREFYINPKEGTKCGPFGSALKKDEFKSQGIPVWNMDNIAKDGRFVEAINLWIDEDKYNQLLGYSTNSGDVIISRAGTVGKMCVLNTQFKKSIISTNLIRVRFGKELLPLYFVSLMSYCKGRIGRLQTGADGTFTHMNTGILDNLKFPIPPIELQTQFAQIVEKTEAFKVQYQSSLLELENLYGSLSQRAFRGELTLNQPKEQVLMAAEPVVGYQANRSK